ncbi:hypothetical protein JCM19236_6474 [Vibrio sp. JCM 19236]|nr:hypothetical protein JCM19236_6474 [Vibrio sp. JCM 19236]
MADLGYGAEYRYAHDEPGAYALVRAIFRPSLTLAGTIILKIEVWRPKSLKS